MFCIICPKNHNHNRINLIDDFCYFGLWKSADYYFPLSLNYFLQNKQQFGRAQECRGHVFFLQVCDPPTPLRHAQTVRLLKCTLFSM